VINNLKWSESEKKLSRRVFEAALTTELAEIMSDFKSRAAQLSTPQDMWDLEDYLTRKRRMIDEKYDYRYSQLIFVFGRLVREGRIQESELNGLSKEKLEYIMRIVSL
jgi:hypothetical protein